jgi:hypothetical protein
MGKQKDNKIVIAIVVIIKNKMSKIAQDKKTFKR